MNFVPFIDIRFPVLKSDFNFNFKTCELLVINCAKLSPAVISPAAKTDKMVKVLIN